MIKEIDPRVKILVGKLDEIIQLLENDHKKMTPLVLKISEAAELMKVSVPTLRDHFLCRPDFPKVEAGVRRHLIPYQALVDWIDHQSKQHG